VPVSNLDEMPLSILKQQMLGGVVFRLHFVCDLRKV
jgi:hypothetical protein